MVATEDGGAISQTRVVAAKTLTFDDLPQAAPGGVATRYQEMTFQNGFP